jgi:hypothetical protein
MVKNSCIKRRCEANWFPWLLGQGFEPSSSNEFIHIYLGTEESDVDF